MQHAAAPFRSASKNARSFVKPQISAVHLYSLPRSIIPRDIRRLAEKVGIVGAYEVHLAYTWYRADGRAYMYFSDPKAASAAATKLDGMPIAGQITRAVIPNRSGIPLASRGHGPSAGIKDRGRTVHIEGLPNMKPDELADALARERFTVEDTLDSPGVLKTAHEHEEKPAWLIRMNTVSEAHRLVRRYHMTLLDNSALVQAHIIY